MRIKNYFGIGRDAVVEEGVIRIIGLDETDLNKDDLIYINKRRFRVRIIKPTKSYEEKKKVYKERYIRNKDKLLKYRKAYYISKVK